MIEDKEIMAMWVFHVSFSISIGICVDTFCKLPSFFIVRLIVSMRRVKNVSFNRHLCLVTIGVETSQDVDYNDANCRERILCFRLLPYRVRASVPIPIFDLGENYICTRFSALAICVSCIYDSVAVRNHPNYNKGHNGRILYLTNMMIRTAYGTIFRRTRIRSSIPKDDYFPFRVKRVKAKAMNVGMSIARTNFHAILTLDMSERMVVVTSAILLSNRAVTNARLRIARCFVIFRREFFYRSPTWDCQERDAPACVLNRAKDNIPTSDHDRRVT